MVYLIFFAGLVVSYVVGSIPSSYLVGKIGRGIDLREHGSGNLGATNAFRVLGWKTGVLVLICDMLKGAIPVLFFPVVMKNAGVEFPGIDAIAVLIGLMAILGHIFTVFMRFRGGKGVATSMGVFLTLAPAAFGITLVVCVILILATRYVSVASLTGSVLLPVLVIWLYPEKTSLIVFTVVIGLLVIIRHRGNIARLFKGEENKLFT